MKDVMQIYEKRKNVLLPICLVIASLIIALRVIYPQFNDISEVQSLLTKKNKEVSAKEEVLRFFTTNSVESIDNNYKLTTTALPIQKDVVMIFAELNNAADKANVELGGFTLQVGDIYSVNKKDTVDKSVNGVPFLSILVSVKGQGQGLKSFADEMYRSLPLVEIVSVDLSENEARYKVNFFYKPIALRTSDLKENVKDLSIVEKQQLEILKSWSNANPF